ncbi:unnamed protein product, partial [Mycena citricolor]
AVIDPLTLPELLARILSFVADPQRRNLLPCALVSRAWVHPSQTLLFRSISLYYDYKPEEWLKLTEILRGSPRLASHIRVLGMSASLCSYVQRELLHIALPNLRSLSFSHFHEITGQETVDDLQQLISTAPRLQRVALALSLPEGSFYNAIQRIFARCSHSLRHLRLQIGTREWDTVDFRGEEKVVSPSQIFLDSLDLPVVPLELADVFSHREGLLSLDQLRTLWCLRYEMLDWPGICVVRQSIYALEFQPPIPDEPITSSFEMADFPNLSVIGLRYSAYLSKSAPTCLARFFRDVFRPTQMNSTVKVIVLPERLDPHLDWQEADAVMNEIFSAMSPPPMIAVDRLEVISQFLPKLSLSGRMRKINSEYGEEILLTSRYDD